MFKQCIFIVDKIFSPNLLYLLFYKKYSFKEKLFDLKSCNFLLFRLSVTEDLLVMVKAKEYLV